MTQFDDWDFEDDEPETAPQAKAAPLPKELRKLIRDAKAREKSQAEEIETLKRTLREGAVASALTARNVPAKVKSLIPESVGADPEAIGKWLDEYSDLFGGQQTANPSTPGGDVPAVAVNPVIANPDIAAIQRMQNTASTGESLGGALQQQWDRVNDPNLTEEQLDAMIAAAKTAPRMA
ncbi:hypothetical protein [Herbidospora cretacea]|uniref:hypothetical protein n=1 Tax=Herbidospora cretacea TaxID=28444 RepID=UPI000773F44A|nr:hypothetical protein [Herbidospora cretacea]